MTDPRQAALASDLAVTAEELSDRALSLFERESGMTYPAPLVLCGAGRLGRVTLAGLRRAGVPPIAIADNNAALHGTRFDGCEVMSIEGAVGALGQAAVFVTTVYTAQPLRSQLVKLGARVASSRAVFFQHPDQFLPHGSIQWPATIVQDTESILAGIEAWADEASRDEYVAQIRWQLLQLNQMPAWLPPEQTYFPDDLIRLGDHEAFVDCGAFDGDTVRAVIQRTGGRFASILALEPDPGNYAALSRFISTLPAEIRGRIETHQVAVHSHAATLLFDSGDGAGSNLSDGGDLQVSAVALDDLLGSRTPTFVKMDIEGAEPVALMGACATLSRHKPTLAVCLYHRREHLWQVPRIILDANPTYRLCLRRHSDESWETICYAIVD
jgi:FkbM family methyltransferase